MPSVDVNWMGVVWSVVASMLIGYAWYSMSLFGRRWMELIGKKEEDLKEGVGTAMTGMVLAAGLAAYVLAHFVSYTGADTLVEGATTGFWVWLGFVATALGTQVLYEKRSTTLYAINAGYHLVMLAAMGAILAIM